MRIARRLAALLVAAPLLAAGSAEASWTRPQTVPIEGRRLLAAPVELAFGLRGERAGVAWIEAGRSAARVMTASAR